MSPARTRVQAGGMPTGPDAPATLTPTIATPPAYQLEPSAAWPPPTPAVAPPTWESQGIAIVVVPTIILGVGWLVVWFFANWMLAYCRSAPTTSTFDERLAVAIATAVWMLPSLIGQEVNRRRGRPHRWQWWIAGSIVVLGAVAISRLDPFEFCML
jgi:hypothetical protein